PPADQGRGHEGRQQDDDGPPAHRGPQRDDRGQHQDQGGGEEPVVQPARDGPQRVRDRAGVRRDRGVRHERDLHGRPPGQDRGGRRERGYSPPRERAALAPQAAQGRHRGDQGHDGLPVGHHERAGVTSDGEYQHDHLPGQAQAGPGRGGPPPAQHSREGDQRPPGGKGDAGHHYPVRRHEVDDGRGEHEPTRYGPPGGRGQQNGPGARKPRGGAPLTRTRQDPAEPLADTGHDQVDRLARLG